MQIAPIEALAFFTAVSVIIVGTMCYKLYEAISIKRQESWNTDTTQK